MSKDGKEWKNLYFDQATLMRLWRYQIVTLFRQKQAQLVIPPQETT